MVCDNSKFDYSTLSRDSGEKFLCGSNLVYLTRNSINTRWFNYSVKSATEKYQNLDYSTYKEKYIKIIADAISNNLQGDVVVLSVDTFLSSYPESIDLLVDYYDSLYTTLIRNYSGFSRDGRYNPEKTAKEFYQNVLTESKLTLLIIYGSHIMDLISKDLKGTMDKLRITTSELTSILNHYKCVSIHGIERICDLKEDEASFDIAPIIIHDFIENKMTKKEICEKYSITAERFNIYADIVISKDDKLNDVISEQLTDNSHKYYFYLQDLISSLANYIQNGIIIDDKKISFTMLDYLLYTHIDLKDLNSLLMKTNDFKTMEELRNKSIIMRFYNAKGVDLGTLMNDIESILNKKIVFCFGENRVEVDEEMIKEVYEFFDKNNIPRRFNLLYIALNRLAKGQDFSPILRLREDEKNIKESPKIFQLK